MRFGWRGVAAALLLWSGGADPAAAEQLLAAGAASLREPLLTLARQFEAGRGRPEVAVSFGASSFLAAQIRAGAPIEVFASADERIVARLLAEGLVEPGASAPLVGNRLVVMAAPGVPLAAPTDLLADRVRRLAVPEGSVPVGRYARAWLRERGMLRTLAPRIVPTEHARATLAAVDLGNVDAAIVYASDARVARAARLAFAVPEAEQPRIVYALARLRGAGPAAHAFYDFLLGPEARDVFLAAGFVAP